MVIIKKRIVMGAEKVGSHTKYVSEDGSLLNTTRHCTKSRTD
jgi:hypothetical protein